MSSSSPTGSLVEVVHQRARLGILTVVNEAPRVEFRFLADELGLTAGNLSQHLRVLEDAGLVHIDKVIDRRRTRTWVSITEAGRCAFLEEIAALKRLVRRVEARAGSTPPPSAHEPVGNLS